MQKLSYLETLKSLTEYYKLSSLVYVFFFTSFLTFLSLPGLMVLNPKILEVIAEINYMIKGKIDITVSKSVISQVCVFFVKKGGDCLDILGDFLLVGTSLITINMFTLFVMIVNIFLGYMVIIKFQNKYKKTNMNLKQADPEVQEPIMTLLKKRITSLVDSKRYFITTASQKTLFYPMSFLGSAFVVGSQDKKDQLSASIKYDLIFCYIISSIFSLLFLTILIFNYNKIAQYSYSTMIIIIFVVFMISFNFLSSWKIKRSTRRIKGLQKLNRVESLKNLAPHCDSLFPILRNFKSQVQLFCVYRYF